MRFLAVLVLLLVLPIQAAPAHPSVVATMKPFSDIVHALAPDIDVSYIIKPGFDPHTYQLSKSDIEMVSNARVFIYLGLEPFAESLIRHLPRGCIKVKLMDRLSVMSEKGGLHGVWLHPENLRSMSEAIEEALREAFPGIEIHRDSLELKLESLESKLEDVGSSLREENFIAAVPGVVYQLLAMGVEEDRIYLLSKAPDSPPTIEERNKAEELAREEAILVSALSQAGIGPADQAAEQIASSTGATLVRIMILPHWDQMDVFEMILFNAYKIATAGPVVKHQASRTSCLVIATAVLFLVAVLAVRWGAWRL